MTVRMSFYLAVSVQCGQGGTCFTERASQGRWHEDVNFLIRALDIVTDTRCGSRKNCVAFPRMYEISHAVCTCADMYITNTQMYTGISTALWDALLAGLMCRVLALLQRAFLAVARKPARGSRERALSPRERVKP